MKRKTVVSLLLILLIFIMNIFNVFSHDKSILPYYIKIGLFFGSTAKTELSIKSDTTFEVGIFDEYEFTCFFDLNEDKILLRRDKPYINENSNIYTGDCYHIRIGGNFSDYIKANNFLNSIGIKDVEIYLCYENGWKIYGGSYTNKLDAEDEANYISKNYGCETGIINPSDTRVQVMDEKNNIIFMYDSSDEIYFVGKRIGNNVPLVSTEGVGYRGGVTAKRLSGSDMTIINKLPLEEYLYGVIPAEMPASWPAEALKAQAIAARGFAAANLNKYERFDFNLCTTTSSQVYKGYSGEHPNTNKAVDETINIVMFYNGSLIEPYYHSNSGGCTEDSENIWLNPLPYIRGVMDDFSLDAPYSTWSVSFTKEEIKNYLAGNNIFIGDILDIRVTSVSDNGRVLSLTVYGTNGQEILEKEKSRFILGLKSSQFTINSDNKDNGIADDNDDYIKLAISGSSDSKPQLINLKGKYIINNNGIHEIKNIEEILIYDGNQYKNVSRGGSIRRPAENIIPQNVFVFDGKGYGHGLGMSQYGAKNMAELGYKYDEILAHYYTGIKVE
ncbi:MAG TPA: SpoIID/LytB domain-containing protein [Clostridia bacterium]|nr:SpoIID/LytB domain-containing protein [Clostridia bacterium]